MDDRGAGKDGDTKIMFPLFKDENNLIRAEKCSILQNPGSLPSCDINTVILIVFLRCQILSAVSNLNFDVC